MRRSWEIKRRFMSPTDICDSRTIIVPHPQSGKSRSMIFHLMDRLDQPGKIAIIGVSSHSEAGSLLKYFLEYQRLHKYGKEVLFIWLMGINRFCPHWNEIRKRYWNKDFKLTEYCKKHCDLWNVRTIREEDISHPEKPRGRPPKILSENKYDLRLKVFLIKEGLKTTEKLLKITVSPLERMMIAIMGDVEEKRSWFDYYYIRGCPRALIMRRLIKKRDSNKQRSILSYPSIIVVPHELIPLVLHFSAIYSWRVYLVIDEFDRLLEKYFNKIIAERWKVKPGEWTQLLVKYNMIPDGSVALMDIVDQRLKQVEEKGKIEELHIMGSSIPLLPRKILEKVKGWMGSYTLIYKWLKPPRFDRVGYSDPTPGSLIIVGSKNIAVALLAQYLLQKPIILQHSLSFEKIYEKFVNMCTKIGGQIDGLVCVKDNKRIVLKIWMTQDGEVYAYDIISIRLGNKRDYLSLHNNIKITWLGGRLTRGVRWDPHEIKNVIIMTKGQYRKTEEVLDIRWRDLVQVIYRMHSSPQIYITISPGAVQVVEELIERYNKSIAFLMK